MNKYIEVAYYYYNKALDLLEDNYITNAINYLNKSIRFYDKDIDTLNLLGLCYYYKCNFNQAITYWQKSISINKNNNEALEYIDFVRNDPEFQNLIDKYNRSIDLVHNQKYEKAIKLLKEIIANNKELIEPYQILGLTYMELGKFKKALNWLKNAQQLDNGNSDIQKYIIDCKNHIKPINSKKDQKFKYISIASLIIIIIIAGLQFNYYQENISSQKLVYEKKIEDIKEDNYNLRQKNNKISTKIDQLKKETKKLTEDKSKLKNSETNLIVLGQEELFVEGVKLYREGLYLKATKLFEKLIKRDIKDYLKRETLFFLASSYQEIENYDKAIKLYKDYINRYPSTNYYDDSIYKVGLLLNKLGNEKESQEILKKLSKEVPDSIYLNSKVKDILNKG